MLRQLSLIILYIGTPLISYCQFSLENIDTSRLSLQNIDTVKSCQLVKVILQDFFNNGNADTIASKCDLPITIESKTYTTSKELSDFFHKVITSASSSKSKPNIDKVLVLGRRQESFNGFIKIDILYIIGIMKFNINGQAPEKMSIFAIRNPNSPKLVGIHIE